MSCPESGYEIILCNTNKKIFMATSPDLLNQKLKEQGLTLLLLQSPQEALGVR